MAQTSTLLRERGDEHFRASLVEGRAPVLVVSDVNKAISLYAQAAEALDAHDRALAEEKLGIANDRLATFEAKTRVVVLSRALPHFLCAVSLRAQVDAAADADAPQWYDAIKTQFDGSLTRLVGALRGTELKAALESMDKLVRTLENIQLENIQRPAGSIVPATVFAEMQFKARHETAKLHFRSAELAVEAGKYSDAVAELDTCLGMLQEQAFLPDEADLDREELALRVYSKQVRRASPEQRANRAFAIRPTGRSCKTAACYAGRASHSYSALPRWS